MNRKRIKKILVVDDEPAIIDLVHSILADNGYEVTGAKDGREGLKVFESTNPDLVITDIVMPDMEGIEFMRNLVKKRKGLPIIVMSGNAVGTKFLETARIFGARATLRKPFTVQELLEIVTAVGKRTVEEESSAANK